MLSAHWAKSRCSPACLSTSLCSVATGPQQQAALHCVVEHQEACHTCSLLSWLSELYTARLTALCFHSPDMKMVPLCVCRHFTFYIWKDILNARPITRHLFVPLYLYSGWSVWESLRSSRQLGIFMTVAMLSTLITLVPAKLVEFR